MIMPDPRSPRPRPGSDVPNPTRDPWCHKGTKATGVRTCGSIPPTAAGERNRSSTAPPQSSAIDGLLDGFGLAERGTEGSRRCRSATSTRADRCSACTSPNCCWPRPSAGLDPVPSSSHQLELGERLCDRVAVHTSRRDRGAHAALPRPTAAHQGRVLVRGDPPLRRGSALRFTCARTAGWSADFPEQHKLNRLSGRPPATSGPRPRTVSTVPSGTLPAGHRRSGRPTLHPCSSSGTSPS